METVAKAKLCELDEEVRSGFTMCLSKELTGVVVGFVGNKRFLFMFQDMFGKEMRLN